MNKESIEELGHLKVLKGKLHKDLLTDDYMNFVQAVYDFLLDYKMQKSNQGQELKLLYTIMFKDLPNPKAENANYLIFLAVYSVLRHMHIIDHIESDARNYLDAFHVILHKVNGVFISDHFLQHNLRKYFTENYLNYTKNQNPPPPYVKPDKFFGTRVEFPALKSDEGHLFAKTLQNIFKPPNQKREQVFQRFTQSEVKLVPKTNLRRMRINLNSLSPSLANVLSYNTICQEKPIYVNHPVQKSSMGDELMMQRLKELNQVRETNVVEKPPTVRIKNIIEDHNLSQPPKEFFQVHKKVDIFFKSMLELNYVLDNRKESVNDLPSVKLLKSQSEFFKKQQFMAPTKLTPRQPAKKKIIFELEPIESPPGSPNKTSIKQIYLGETKNIPVENQPQLTQNLIKPKGMAGTQKIVSLSQTAIPIYTNKQIDYTKQFEKAVSAMPTDFKIGELQTRLDKKTHDLKKNTQKYLKR